MFALSSYTSLSASTLIGSLLPPPGSRPLSALFCAAAGRPASGKSPSADQRSENAPSQCESPRPASSIEENVDCTWPEKVNCRPLSAAAKASALISRAVAPDDAHRAVRGQRAAAKIDVCGVEREFEHVAGELDGVFHRQPLRRVVVEALPGGQLHIEPVGQRHRARHARKRRLRGMRKILNGLFGG